MNYADMATAALIPAIMFADKPVMYLWGRMKFYKEMKENPNTWLPGMKPEFPSYSNFYPNAW